MTPTDDDDARGAIARQAVEWFLVHQCATTERRECSAFMAWLRTSPVHVEEYLRTAALSRDLGAAAADPSLCLEGLLADARRDIPPQAAVLRLPGSRPAARHRPSRGRGAWIEGLSAVALLGLVGVAVLWMRAGGAVGSTQRYATLHGEERSWALPDGSTVQLNTDSIIRVHFTGSERLVDLLQGQAFFAVARDTQRHFRVRIGGADVVAVGTQFDIDRQGAAAVVTVVEGHVAIYGEGGRRAPAAPLSLGPGQQLRLAYSEVADPPARVNLERSESWRTGRIVFERQPLGEVAQQFNRYAPVPLDVSDPVLRTLLISGAFDARDTASFLAFLQTIDGVTLQRGPGRIQVSRRATRARRGGASPSDRGA